MEANALREFLADTDWGALDVLLVDLPPAPIAWRPSPGCCRRSPARSSSRFPRTFPALVVRKSITVARQGSAPVLGVIENMAGLFPGPGASSSPWRAVCPFSDACRSIPCWPPPPTAASLYVLSAPEAPASRALSAIAARLRETLAAARS